MATEIDMPESVCLKKGEMEDNALSSDILEENVTQLLVNKVKQLEINQPLETSSQVVETVNTQLETGTPTNESGTFFQALSVPKVTADEHINTPESCEATKTEDQEVRNMTDIEAFTEGKPNEDPVVAIASKEAFANEQQPNKGDHELVEAIPAQTQGSNVHSFAKELEQVTDISCKDESVGGSLSTETEAINNEGKEPTTESVKEDTKDVTLGVETEDQRLHEGATDDVCVSTDVKHEEETIKNEEENSETKEAVEESGPEKAERELSDSMVPSKTEALNTLDKDQGDSEGITSSQDETCEDTKETTGQHATTMSEQDQNERPRELIKEQIEDKSIDAQEASEPSEDVVKSKGEQKPEVSVKKTEEEEETEKIRPTTEIEKKMDQNGSLHAITTDACISTQTKSQVDTIEREKKGEEQATQSDDSRKEKSDSPPNKKVREENISEKVEYEKEQEVNGLDKDQDEVDITSTQDLVFEGGIVTSKKEALDALEKDQGDSERVTSSQDATCEDIKETISEHAAVAEQDQNERPTELIKEQIEDKSIDTHEAIEQYEDGVEDKGEQKPEGSVKKNEEEQETEMIMTSVEIEEKTDQNGVLHAITTDACISTQTKTQADTIEHEEKDEEEATQSDDGQKEKSVNPPIKEVCEENRSEKVEHEKEQEVNMLDNDQDEVDITSTQNVAFKGGLQEKNQQSEGNTVPTGVGISIKTETHEETTENEEKNDEDVTESDDGNTKLSGSLMVKKIREETVSEKAESDEVLKSSDSFSTVLNENEIVSKDEDQEKKQMLYMSEKSQTESQVKTTKLEEGHEEEVIESNDSQNENSDNLSIKEVCEETESEKVEPERAELSDSSSIKLNEKAVAILNKDEGQGKQQGQVEDDVTCSEDATFTEELQGKNQEDIGKEPESDMIRKSLEVDSGEMTSPDEKSVETEYQGSLHDGITTDVCVSTQTELEKESIKYEEKAIEMDVCEETSPENAEPEARPELSDSMSPSKKQTLSTLEKDQGDSEGVTSSQDATCEDTKETTPAQYASGGADFKEQDQNESPTEFLKEETEDKLVDAQKESEQCEHEDIDKKENNPEESVKQDDQEKEQEVNMLEEDQGEDNFTSAQDVLIEEGLQEKNHHSEVVNAKESIEEDVEEIRSVVEITQSVEQQTLINTNATDVCISTQTKLEATTENKEKNDEETIGSEDGRLEKSGNPITKEINEKTVSEKDGSQDGLKLSESPGIVLNENEIMSKDEDQEKEQELYVSERGQSGGDDITNSENASNEDTKETTIGEHVTPVAYFEEGQGLSATPKEFIKEEAEDKSIDAQEATEQCDDGTNNDVEQKEESVNEIAHSSSIIEQAEYTEEFKPSVKTNEEKDVCASTRIESQAQVTKNEEKATEIDVVQMEKYDNPLVKEVCEEIDLNMSESAEDINLSHSSNVEINKKAITSLKDDDREKDQEVSISTEDHGKDNGTSSQHVASEEEGLQEQEGEFLITSESIHKDTEETKSSDETKEKMEQQGLLHVITADVCSSTKTEPIQETTGREEKNCEEAIENDDDGQTKKLECPLVKEVCEVTSSEKADSEVQSGGDEAISSHNASNEEIKETTSGQHATTVAYIEEGLGVSPITEGILKEEAENKSINAQEEVKQCENEAMEKREEKTVESINELVNSLTIEGGINEDELDAKNNGIEAKVDTENQDDRTEDISEMRYEVVAKEKMSLELGNPKEQNVEEVQACLVNRISENSEDEIKKEDRDLSHESVEDTNDNTAKEEQCTLEHESFEEQHIGVNEVSKEKIINLNETAVQPQEDIIASSSSGIPTEDTSNSEKENAESENLPIEDLKTVSEVQIPEDSKLREECLVSGTATHVDEEKVDLTKEISSDDKTEQTTEIKQETVKEECEGTRSKKAELEEGLKLSDSSNMQINEKSTPSFKDEDQEKDSEVNMPAESQDKDDVSSSQNKIFEEDLQEKNYHKKDNHLEFGKSKESVEEDTEEIKSNLGTKENTEQDELLHVVTTDDCSSTHTDHKKEATEKEEKNDEEAIENNEVEEKSIDTQEAFEQHENEAKGKIEQKPAEPANSCSENLEGKIKKDEADAGNDTEKETRLNAEDQDDRGEDGSKMKDEAFSTEKMSTELEQPKAQSVEACLTETKSEKTEDDITEKDEEKSHDNIEVTDDTSIKEEKCLLDGRTREFEISQEHEPVEEQTGSSDEVSKENFTNLNETTLEAQEEIKLSSSLGASTENVEYVSEVQSPEVVLMSEDSKPKEECLISATTAYVDEEKETATKEIPSNENLEPYGSTQQSENLSSFTDENATQSEKISEIKSVYEKRDSEEDVTQENQVNSKENCSEIVKDAILAEEVPLEIEKENEINDHEEQVVEEDNSSTELQKISAQNEKEMTHEEHELHGELKLTSESMIEEDQAIETKPQTEQSDITSEKITSDQISESKLEDTSEKHLEIEKRDMEEEVTLSPENQIKSIENQNETTKNVILTDDVAMQKVKESGKTEVIGQISEEDNCPKELDNPSASDQKELAIKIEYSKLIPAGKTEATEVKAESQIEPENIQAAEDLSCLSKAFSTENNKEAPTLEFEKKEKDEELISQVHPEPIPEMEMKQELPETTNDTCETLISGVLSEKNDKKTEDPVILQSVEKDVIQGVDKRFDEASVSHVQKQEKDFDHEDTNTEVAIPIDDVKRPDVELKFDMDATADKAEKGVLKEDMPCESTCDGSKITEEVSRMKKEKLELDSPVTPGTVATKDLEISQKDAINDLIIVSHDQPEIQNYEVSDDTVDEQSPIKSLKNEGTESKLLAEKIDAPHEQEVPVTKSLIAEKDDLKSTKATETEPQCSSEVFKEDNKTNDEKEKLETTESAKILFAEVLDEPTKGSSEVAENLIGEREPTVTKDQHADKEDIGGSEVKTDEEDEEDNEDNQKIGSCSDAPVMVEASKDMETKVHKKSNNILSGVGSKVKHSIAKVKKAITGKSSNSKPPSPKEKDQVFA